MKNPLPECSKREEVSQIWENEHIKKINNFLYRKKEDRKKDHRARRITLSQTRMIRNIFGFFLETQKLSTG